MDRFFGTYHRFETASHKEGGELLNADNLIGDTFDISIEYVNGTQKAWLVNKFGRRIGFFDADFSRELSVLEASDTVTTAFLSFVAYTEKEDGGTYWGEMAVVSRETRFREEFEPLILWLSSKLKQGVRPKINLDRKAVDKYFESGFTWRPEQNLPAPRFEKGTVLMKDSLSLGDKIIEAGRQRKAGCYILTWAFFIVITALLLLLLKALFSS